MPQISEEGQQNDVCLGFRAGGSWVLFQLS